MSNRLGNQETTDQHIEMWTLDPETLETQEIKPSMPILMANGATNWAPTKVLLEQQVGDCAGLRACMPQALQSLLMHQQPPRPKLCRQETAAGKAATWTALLCQALGLDSCHCTSLT